MLEHVSNIHFPAQKKSVTVSKLGRQHRQSSGQRSELPGNTCGFLLKLLLLCAALLRFLDPN